MNRKFLMSYIWDISEEDIAKLENAEHGEPVHIENSPVPAIFEENSKWYLYTFTSMNTIPEDFQQKYAVKEHPMDYIYALMCAIEKVVGKEIMLAIDPFDENDEKIFAKEDVGKLL